MTMQSLLTSWKQASNRPGYRGDIDGLRAVSVICIILFHFQLLGLGGGFIGVDVFFVISGYWITAIVRDYMERGRFSFAQFYERRLRRIGPSMLVMLALTAIGATLVLSLDAMAQFGHSMASSLLFAANIYFYRHSGYFDADTSSFPLVHLWSLGVEAQFYLIWPFVVMLAARLLGMKRAWMAMVPLAVISLALAVWLAGSHASAGFYLLPSRLVEFLMGAAVLWLPSLPANESGRSIADSCLLAGLAMIGLSIFLYTSATPFPSFYALLPCLGAAAIIYGAPSSALQPVLGNPVMAYIGRISYELYLFHWPVRVLYSSAIAREVTLVDTGIMLVLTVLLSVITYHAISCPLRFGRAGKPAPKRNFFIGCTVAFVLLCVVAGSINLSRGWAWRLPADTRLFVTNAEGFHQAQYGGIAFHENTLHTLGDKSATPQFLLMGDSFAGQYAGAMDAFLKGHHQAAYLFYVNGCLFMPHNTAHMYGKQTPECAGAYERMAQVLANNRLPVIQAQSWTSYKGGITLGNGESKQFSAADNRDYYAYMMAVVEQMRNQMADRKFAIVGVSPGIPEQKTMADCFAAPRFVSHNCAKATSAPEAERQNGQEFNAAAAAYVAAHPEVTFINPRAAVCHEGACYAAEGTQIFYSDRSHFTSAGARKVLDHYQEFLLGLKP